MSLSANIADPSASGTGTRPFSSVLVTNSTGGFLQEVRISATSGSFGRPLPTGSAPITYTIAGQTFSEGAGLNSISLWLNDSDTAGFQVSGFGTNTLTIQPNSNSFTGDINVKNFTAEIAESFLEQIVLLDSSGQSRSFSGTITDIGGQPIAATFNPANQPPVAVDDSVITAFETNVPIEVLFNDSDADGSLAPDTVTVVAQGTKGNAVVIAEGFISYTPNPGATGVESFTYTVQNNDGAVSNEATVTVTIDAGLNQPPLASNDTAATAFETAAVITVLANDDDPDGTIDPTSVQVASQGTKGSAVANANANGTITYTPNAGESGADSFTYTVADDDGAVSDPATVTVTIATNQPPPVAGNDSAATAFATAVAIDVLLNDSDANGTVDPTTVQIAAQGTKGTASVDPVTGTITYTPDAGQSGQDSFT